MTLAATLNASDVRFESADDLEALKTPFVQTLIRVIRAHDTHGAWDNKNDQMLLRAFIITKEQRKHIPIVGDPDPDILSRLECFYGAIALEVEKKTGVMAAPLMRMSHEGFGRMVVTAGRLLVINKHLRDVHRFGFLTLAKLAEEGGKMVDDAAAWIAKYPEVARA